MIELLLCVQLFEDWSERTGVQGVEAPTVAFADLDGDGRPDAVLNRTKVFLQKEGRLVAKGEVRGGRTPQAVQFGDVDGDGDLDLFFCWLTEKDDGCRNEIWLNDGAGSFALKKDSGVGTEPDLSITACFLDYDADGKLDLFVGNWYATPWKSQEARPSRLYRGRGDGTFEDVTERAKILGIAEPGKRESRKPVFGVTHTDWNNDGRQDLLVQVYGRQWNQLWRNNGDGTFTDVAAETTFDGDDIRHGKYLDEVKKLFKEKRNVDLEDEPEWRANGNTFDGAVADFDGDGDMDCFLGEIAHWWAGTSSDRSMLLVNRGREHGYAFERRALPRPDLAKNANEGDLHAGWLDVDNDGLLDLLVASSDYPDEQILKLYRQKPDHTFEDWTEKLGFRWVSASQISLADFDRDGATDILVGRNHMRLTKEQQEKYPLSVGLFRNVAAKGNRFFSLRLLGQAVGARVTIWVDGKRQVREVYGGLGHAGHRDDPECRFGLGKATKIDKIEVRWPDASLQEFYDVEGDRLCTLAKGGTITTDK